MRKTITTLILVVLALHLSHDHSWARPKVSLVLGGGAARGISHIGLLKAFEEEGIPIDYIVGTSMGSVIAGLYAAGLSADNLHYLATHVNLDELFTPMVPPKGGFLSTERFETFIDILTDDAYFETLPVPFSTVALNLVSGEEVTIKEGKLSRAIIASMSIPAVFPPTRIGEDYFVDGGMRSLVPVEVARRDNPDLIIAVDVRSRLNSIDHDTVISNLQLASMLVLSTDTGRQLELADIVIAPGVSFESYMDYDRAEFFIAEGYEAAKEAMPQIRSALTALDPNFTYSPSVHPGYPADEFATKLSASLDEAQNGASTNGKLASRFSFDLDSLGRTTTRFGITVPLMKLADKVTTFGRYSSQKYSEDSIRTFSFGVGNCERTCFSLFGRNESTDPHWGAGVSLEGKTPGNWRYEGEWERSQTHLGWKISAGGPLRPNDPNSMSELQIEFGQDPRGLQRHLRETLGTTVLYKYYYAFNRAAFWEAVNTSTHVYLGIGMSAWKVDQGLDLEPIGEMGLAFEARIFGLYPIRSGLAITYSSSESPWSFRWTVGEW